MGEFFDPREASIDSLIDWLARKRRRDPAAPLAELLEDHAIDQQRLVDIACIDLMQRRRMEHAVKVEDYVDEFPDLSEESHVLDLIDAELCISTELGEAVELEHYITRFPTLADPIRGLFQLEVGDESRMTSALINVGSGQNGVAPASSTSADDNLRQPASSGDFSIEVLPKESTPRQMQTLTQHPLDVPDWFVGEQCVASGPGRWLIRGRDSVRGIALALKVTELPPLITPVQSKQILDACEAASQINHPAWVCPTIAAIQQRHLGVIRPWSFARGWYPHALAQDISGQLRNLASVAFAVAAAHARGATHGGIHVENLLLDHDGKVKIMDAGSSRIGLERWLNPTAVAGEPHPFASLDQRRNLDTQDVIKLIAAAAVEWDHNWARNLMDELRGIAKETPEEACGLIGQTMMRCSDSATSPGDDGRSGHHQGWRRRLARWLTNE